MDTGDVAHTLMSALTRVQNMLAPPPNTAGDAALAASLAPPDTTGDAALAASLAPQVSSLVDPRALRPRFHSRAIAGVRCVRLTYNS